MQNFNNAIPVNRTKQFRALMIMGVVFWVLVSFDTWFNGRFMHQTNPGYQTHILASVPLPIGWRQVAQYGDACNGVASVANGTDTASCLEPIPGTSGFPFSEYRVMSTADGAQVFYNPAGQELNDLVLPLVVASLVYVGYARRKL